MCYIHVTRSSCKLMYLLIVTKEKKLCIRSSHCKKFVVFFSINWVSLQIPLYFILFHRFFSSILFNIVIHFVCRTNFEINRIQSNVETRKRKQLRQQCVTVLIITQTNDNISNEKFSSVNAKMCDGSISTMVSNQRRMRYCWIVYCTISFLFFFIQNISIVCFIGNHVGKCWVKILIIFLSVCFHCSQ